LLGVRGMTQGIMNRKILIIDEHGFSRVCSAILNSSGYLTEIITHAADLPEKLNKQSCCLIVISYPFGVSFFESLWQKNIPVIILSDGIDERMIDLLNNFQNSCCMIKPVDYDKFKGMVKQAVEGSLVFEGGYSIV